MKGLNVLLTGACGRIGKTFFVASKDRYRFTLTDRVEPDFALDDHHFVQADLNDKTALAALLDGIDVIMHLSGIPHASATFDELLPNNILATTYLFEAAVAANVKRLVFASSAQTIEGYPVDRQITPGMPVLPANLYGVSKCYGEALCGYYAAKTPLSTIAVRIGAFEFAETICLLEKRARFCAAARAPCCGGAKQSAAFHSLSGLHCFFGLPTRLPTGRKYSVGSLAHHVPRLRGVELP